MLDEVEFKDLHYVGTSFVGETKFFSVWCIYVEKKIIHRIGVKDILSAMFSILPGS